MDQWNSQWFKKCDVSMAHVSLDNTHSVSKVSCSTQVHMNDLNDELNIHFVFMCITLIMHGHGASYKKETYIMDGPKLLQFRKLMSHALCSLVASNLLSFCNCHM